jgi:hypothetical protein
MFFERLVESLGAASRRLERAIGEESAGVSEALPDLAPKLRSILEVAVEPLVPVLDDAWRYALYGLLARQEGYRKQKLLLVHPLETTLQRAELDGTPDRRGGDAAGAKVPPGHLLSPDETVRALRSYWAYDRVAAYIHYCEDASRPGDERLVETLRELTRAVLKEISLLEVAPAGKGPDRHEPDDLPLRFALRALTLKVKIALGHGRFGKERPARAMEKARVRDVIESRVRGETGLSFEGFEELVAALRGLDARIGSRSAVDLKPPLLSLCDDLERLVGKPGPRGGRATGPAGGRRPRVR